MQEIMKATNTPSIVAVCETLRPTTLPKNLVPSKPAMADPASGARGTANNSCGLSCPAMMTLLLACYFFKSPANEGSPQLGAIHPHYPLSASKSSTLIVSRLRNMTTRIAKPIADSAAATVKMKNTKICPAASPK